MYARLDQWPEYNGSTSTSSSSPSSDEINGGSSNRRGSNTTAAAAAAATIPMTVNAAILVDCLRLQGSMLLYCYEPLGLDICISAASGGVAGLGLLREQRQQQHYIMVANTYNCLMGFITEKSYLDMVLDGGGGGGGDAIEFIPPIGTFSSSSSSSTSSSSSSRSTTTAATAATAPLFKQVFSMLQTAIRSCSNRQLVPRPSRILQPEDLVYTPGNLKFMSYLYHVTTNWPKQYLKDLMNVLYEEALLEKKQQQENGDNAEEEEEEVVIYWNSNRNQNLGFLVYLEKLIDVFNHFNRIELQIQPHLYFSSSSTGGRGEKRIGHRMLSFASELHPPPKCFGPNNELWKQFQEMFTIKVCQTCCNIRNVYMSKSFNRAKIYSDNLLDDQIYSCQEKTTNYKTFELIVCPGQPGVDDIMYYPELVSYINKKKEYILRFNTDSRTSCSINKIDIYREENGRVSEKKSTLFSSSTTTMTCLDYESGQGTEFEVCWGCKMLLRQQKDRDQFSF